MEFCGYVIRLLTEAGIRAGEEYPAGKRLQIEAPVAAVGFRGADFDGGQIRMNVRILSPRTLGGWACQNAAMQAAAVLHQAGHDCQMGAMEFLEGSDCFCITVAVGVNALFDAEWSLGKRWSITCGGTRLENVEQFRTARDQGRRVIGSIFQGNGAGVTPGSGAWVITLVQSGGEDVQMEPFVLTVEDGERFIAYTGCYWDREEWDFHQGGLRRTRTGFALAREVLGDG